jgi:hypothetical protein
MEKVRRKNRKVLENEVITSFPLIGTEAMLRRKRTGKT